MPPPPPTLKRKKTNKRLNTKRHTQKKTRRTRKRYGGTIHVLDITNPKKYIRTSTQKTPPIIVNFFNKLEIFFTDGNMNKVNNAYNDLIQIIKNPRQPSIMRLYAPMKPNAFIHLLNAFNVLNYVGLRILEHDFENEIDNKMLKNSFELLELLLDKGATVNKEFKVPNNSTSYTLLSYALTKIEKFEDDRHLYFRKDYTYDTDMRSRFIYYNNKILFDFIDEISSEIDFAKETKYKDILGDLFEPYINDEPNRDRYINSRYEICKILVQKGANVNTKIADNIPIISFFIYHMYNHRSDNKLDLLLTHGADVNMLDANGDPPIFYAIRRGDKWTFDLLIENGANLNAVNKEGNNVFHIAAKYKANADICRVLFEKLGLEMAWKMNNNDKTVTDLAAASESTDFQNIFAEYQRKNEIEMQELSQQLGFKRAYIGESDIESVDEKSVMDEDEDEKSVVDEDDISLEIKEDELSSPEWTTDKEGKRRRTKGGSRNSK